MRNAAKISTTLHPTYKSRSDVENRSLQAKKTVPESPVQPSTEKLPASKAVELSPEGKNVARNLDDDCHSCLLFPEKDGTFMLPDMGRCSNPFLTPLEKKSSTPHESVDPEDELDMLMKNYNNTKKEYINKITEKLSSYQNAPFVNVMGRTQDTMGEDKRRSSANSISPIICSPLYPSVGSPESTKYRKALSQAVAKPADQYVSNIANIISNTRAINSAYYQSRKLPIGNSSTRPAGADSTSISFKPSIGSSNRFPKDVFSLNNRTKKPLP